MAFDLATFKNLCRTRSLGRQITHYPECDSTSQRARELTGKDLAPGLVLVADHQTHGKGRWGRHWLSKPGFGLLFTMVLKMPGGKAAPSHASIAVAVAACRQLEKWSIPVKIKWPNDLVVHGRKLGGMLLETHAGCLLAGLGINLSQLEEDFDSQVRGEAISLLQLGLRPGPEELLAGILLAVEEEMQVLEKTGFQAVKQAWHERALYLGGAVSVKTRSKDGEPVEGTVMGLDSDGALLLRGDHGLVFPVVAGDLLQIRPAVEQP